MDRFKEIAGNLWRRYRGLPMWGQVVIGIVLLSVIVGPFLGETEDASDDESAEAASTTESEQETTTTERTTTADEETTTTAEPETTTTEPPDPGRISRATFSDTWPLSVDEGTVRCMPGSAVIFVTDDSTIYAVNGLARGRAEDEGWREIDEIWLDNPELEGTKIDIGPIIDLGLSLCD